MRKEFLKYSRYVTLFYIFVFLVVTYYFSEMVSYVMQKFRIQDVPVLGDQFTMSLLISVIVVGAATIFYWRRKTTNQAAFETAHELANVDWPDAEETKNSTVVTISFSILFSFVLAAMDLVWAFFTSFLV